MLFLLAHGIDPFRKRVELLDIFRTVQAGALDVLLQNLNRAVNAPDFYRTAGRAGVFQRRDRLPHLRRFCREMDRDLGIIFSLGDVQHHHTIPPICGPCSR